MNTLKGISDSEDKDIVISLPKDKSWLEYLSSFMEMKANGQMFNIIIGILPKTVPGKKCFIVFDGFLRGYMEISRIRETEDNEFCIELCLPLVSTGNKIPMADINEFKYFFDNSNTQ